MSGKGTKKVSNEPFLLDFNCHVRGCWLRKRVIERGWKVLERMEVSNKSTKPVVIEGGDLVLCKFLLRFITVVKTLPFSAPSSTLFKKIIKKNTKVAV